MNTLNKYHVEINICSPIKDTSCIDFINNLKIDATKIQNQYAHQAGKKYFYTGADELIHAIINPELSEIFKSKNLTPKWVFIFGHARKDLYPNFKNPTVHTDLVEVNGEWVKIPFSINWELSETDTEFKWWDTSNTKVWYPSVEKMVIPNDPVSRVKSCWYGDVPPMTVGFEHNFPCLETFTLKSGSASLINPSIAHSTTYPSGADYRCGLSFKFPIEQISTWEQGCELFKEFVIH
jgi:hypothetical protein